MYSRPAIQSRETQLTLIFREGRVLLPKGVKMLTVTSIFNEIHQSHDDPYRV